MDMHIDRYEPFKSRGYVPLPKWINDKKAVINVQNLDNRCFFYAVESVTLSDTATVV